jgi:predicted metal-dependent hydrolase
MQLGLPFLGPASGTTRPPSAALNPAPGTQHTPPRIPPHPVEFVRHPGARRYVIRVRGDGTVRVTIPRGGSKREAQEFAARQQRWIEKERERVAQENAHRHETIPPAAAPELRARATRELPPRLLELAAVHGLRVSRVSVRNQRWRWGSCSRSGHICLNWRLVDMPPDIRDYVMIHELMHLRRMDHSPKFWKLVAAACPDYQAARKWLREYGRMRES